MKAKIYPSKATYTNIDIASSKSLAHRSIICASLANGTSHISNVDYSIDIDATIEAMRHLGAKIQKEDHVLIIEGIRDFKYDGKIIDAHESGSTLRFLIPLFSLCNKEVRFTGSKRLFKRPLNIYENIYQKQHLIFEYTDEGIITKGQLKSGEYLIEGNISSQFISGLLFILPLLEDDSTIRIIPPFESRSYVDLTLDILHQYGIKADFTHEYIIMIKGNQKYIAHDYKVERDYSQLAFFASLGLINNDINCPGFRFDSLQGDKAIIDIIQKMNGKLIIQDNSYHFMKSDLLATRVDLNNCPDLGPMCFALACCAKGESIFTNANRLRIKESDRIEAMENELRKLNQNIYSEEDKVYIKGGNIITPLDELDGHNDHRIIMALSILATIADKPVVIKGAEAINKSYPKFFEDLRKCNIKVDLYD